MIEGDLVGQQEGAPFGHHDILSVTAVTVVADHRAGVAELLAPPVAVGAAAAGGHVVQADPVAHPEPPHGFTGLFHHSGHFVPRGEGQ